MIYADEFGNTWEMLEVDGEPLLIPHKIPKWPDSDDLFLRLAHIQPIGEILENE